jgi:tRNA/rRNA methyltransferase
VGALPFAMPDRSERASQHQMQAFFDNLVRELDKVEFLRPAEKRETMLVNLRNIFTRMDPTKQDMHTLHGVVMAIAEGRKGPAKGGVLDGEQATRLRALLAEHGQHALPSESGTVRGLARLLRRNPTDAERILWEGLRTDRRFAGQFKRQTPVGRHIPDFVSFVNRVAIELINSDETEVIGNDRATRQAWLEARGYRVVCMRSAEVEADISGQLDRLEAGLLERR